MVQKYDLIIVTGEPFPWGKAASNRLLCYATAMAKTKKVLVLTFCSPYNENPTICGCIGGVEYRYMQRSRRRPVQLIRLMSLIYRYIKLLWLLFFRYKAPVAIFLSRKLAYAAIVKCILYLKGTKLYREISETPDNIKKKWRRNVALKMNVIFDGFIVISSGIEESLKPYAKRDANYFLLPVLVDMERFNLEKVAKRNVAFYCSGGNVERDGLLDTLAGFLQYRQYYKNEIKLEIATTLNLNDAYHRKVKDIIIKHPDVFTYLGCLHTTDIPYKLMEAQVLLLTPTQNYLTRGFPTKLGEYLASGTPVICSSIDDLREQIPEDVVRFVAPNSPVSIFEALQDILSNPVEANALGGVGRRWVACNYTMDGFAQSLISFLGI